MFVLILFRVLISEPDVKPDEGDEETQFALVINGHSLVHALHRDLEKCFINVCTQCKKYFSFN